MKKILALCLVVTMCILPFVVSCTPSTDDPSSTTASQTTEPATTEPEELIDRAEPTTSGDFAYTLVQSKATITSYFGKGGDLVIPEKIDGFTVVGISKMLFSYNASITSVSIPGTVVDTGELSFFHCDNLTTVTLGDGVKTIGRSSFNACAKLATVNRSSSVTSISEIAFQGCTSLKSFDLTGITFVGYRAFANSGLTSVVIPASITSMENAAFFGCEALTKADVKMTLEDLPENIFAYCYNLKDVTLAEGIKRIGYGAFYRCYAIESLTLPTTCFKLCQHSLYGCTSLKTLYILDKVDNINVVYFAAEFVPALQTIYYAGTEEQHSQWKVENSNYFFTQATVVCNYTK